MRFLKQFLRGPEVRRGDVPSALDYPRGVRDGIQIARNEIITHLEAYGSTTIDRTQLIAAIRSGNWDELRGKRVG